MSSTITKFKIVFVILIICFVVFIIIDANSTSNELVIIYTSIGEKNTNSKANYKKTIRFLETDVEGKTVDFVGSITAEEALTNQLDLNYYNYTNSEIYQKLVADNRYSSKASALTAVYMQVEPIYGKEFAIGLMANVLAEGNAGMLEGINNSKHYFDIIKSIPQLNTLFSGSNKYIHSDYFGGGTSGIEKAKEALDILITYMPLEGNTTWYYVSGCTADHSSRGSCKENNTLKGVGIGIVQWSGVRRTKLLQLYKERAVTFEQKELEVIEVEYMLQELQGSSNYYKSCESFFNNGTSKFKWKGTESDVYKWAMSICVIYEAPSDALSNAGPKRAKNADELAKYLFGN